MSEETLNQGNIAQEEITPAVEAEKEETTTTEVKEETPEKKEETKVEEPDYSDTSLDNAEKIAKAKGLDYDKMLQEVFSTGNLSEETKAEAIKAGIPEEYINKVIAGGKALQEQQKAEYTKDIGGVDEWDKTLTWISENFTQEQIQELNDDFSKNPSEIAVKAMVKYLNDLRIESEGKPANLLKESSSGVVATDVFKSDEQVVKALQDPRANPSSPDYDPSYRAEIRAKIERSRKAGIAIFGQL